MEFMNPPPPEQQYDNHEMNYDYHTSPPQQQHMNNDGDENNIVVSDNMMYDYSLNNDDNHGMNDGHTTNDTIMDQHTTTTSMYGNTPEMELAARRTAASIYTSPTNATSGATTRRRRKRQSAKVVNVLGLSLPYDDRVLLLLLPCNVLMFMLAGQTLVTSLVIGLIVVYLVDRMDYGEMSFVCFWLTSVVEVIVLWASCIPELEVSVFSILLLINFTWLIVLTTAWGALHFSWFRTEFGEGVEPLENFLFSSMCLPVTAVLTWGIGLMAGVSYAPYFLVGIFYATYHVCFSPMESVAVSSVALAGDSVGSSPVSIRRMAGTFVTALHTLLFVFFPSFFYLVLHHRSLFSLLTLSNWLMLIVVPMVLVLTMSRSSKHHSVSGVLFWLGVSQSSVDTHQRKLITVSMIVLVACVEYRVVFHSFSHYLAFYESSMVVSVVLVTCSMYSALGAIMLAVDGKQTSTVAETNRQRGFRVCAHVCAVTTGLALGVPYYVLPFLLLGAEYACRFYFTQRLMFYMFFAVGFVVAMSWYVRKQFWHLQLSLGGVPVQSVCLLAALMFVSALIAPAVMMVRLPSVVLVLVLCVYFGGLVVVEYVLTRDNASYETEVYPNYLVILTSVFSMWLMRRVANSGAIPPLGYCVVFSLLLTKLAVLFDCSTSEMFDFFLVCITVTPLLTMYKPSVPGYHVPSMSSFAATTHICTIGGAFFYARNTVVKRLLWLVLRDDEPSTSLVWSGAIIVATVCIAPISFVHMRSWTTLRRATSTVLLMAVLFAIIQPEIDFISRKAVHIDSYSSVYSLGHGDARLSSWLLFLALGLTVASITSIVPMPRFMFALTLGTAIGMYVSNTYLPSAFSVQVCFIGIFDSVALLLSYLLTPGPTHGGVATLLYGVFVSLLPFTYFLQGQLFGFAPRRRGKDMLIVSRVALISLHAALNFLVALLIKVKRESDSQKQVRQSRIQGTGYHSSSTYDGRESSGPLVYMGNFSTCLCFGLGVVLNVSYIHGGDAAILMLAPVLLLLNRDGGVFSALSDDRRYFPTIFVTCVFQVAICVYKSYENSYIKQYEVYEMVWSALLKQLLLVVLTIPSLVKLLVFLWSVSKSDDFTLWLITPLNILSIILSDMSATRMLGVMGFLGSVVQLVLSRKMQKRGLRVL